MSISRELLVSSLLHLNVRCDKGVDHGPGAMVWMHPPIHRLLGWASRPSNLRLSRDVWRLDQLKGINSQQVYVKGHPSNSDQATLDRFPTLLEADLINNNDQKIANIVDFVFDIKTGNILYYLVARSNPKIPGSSRWKLSIKDIEDQQPGLVFTSLSSLDDIPIIKSSLRQDFLKKSEKIRNQFQELTVRANNRLEGWLEDLPWDEEEKSSSSYLNNIKQTDIFDDWDNSLINQEYSKAPNRLERQSNESSPFYNESDPWI